METFVTELRAGAAPTGSAAVGDTPTEESPLEITSTDRHAHRNKRQAREDDVDPTRV